MILILFYFLSIIYKHSRISNIKVLIEKKSITSVIISTKIVRSKMFLDKVLLIKIVIGFLVEQLNFRQKK